MLSEEFRVRLVPLERLAPVRLRVRRRGAPGPQLIAVPPEKRALRASA